MKKLLIFLLTACLLAGCGGMTNTAGEQPAPPATKAAEAAAVVFPESLEPISMEALVQSETLFVSYALTALNPYGQYPEGTVINGQGAEALTKWLLGQNALDGLTAYQEGLFLQAEETPVYSGWISPAAENTKAIRLMTTVNVAEVGILEEILPAFKEEYGYEVEIVAEKEAEVYLRAAMGEADLLLAPEPREGDVFAENDNFRTIPGFPECHIPRLRCP